MQRQHTAREVQAILAQQRAADRQRVRATLARWAEIRRLEDSAGELQQLGLWHPRCLDPEQEQP